MARKVYGIADSKKVQTDEGNGIYGRVLRTELPAQNTIDLATADLASWSILQPIVSNPSSANHRLFSRLTNPTRVVAIVATTITWKEERQGPPVLTWEPPATSTDGQEGAESTTAKGSTANYPVLEPTTVLLLGFFLLGLVIFGRKFLRKQ